MIGDRLKKELNNKPTGFRYYEYCFSTFQYICIYMYICMYIYNYCRTKKLNSISDIIATNNFIVLKQPSGNK